MHTSFDHRPPAWLKALVLAACLSTATGCPESITPLGGNLKREPGGEPARPPSEASGHPLARETASSQAGATAIPPGANSTPPPGTPPPTPSAAAPTILLGDIVRTAELPAGFTSEVRVTPGDRAAGADSPYTSVTVRSAEKKSQGRFVSVSIGRDDRFVTERADKIAHYRAYIDAPTQVLKDLGYRVTHQEIPDVNSIDLNQRIRARLTFERGDRRMEVEHLIFLVAHTIHISVSADHDDDFQLLSKWAESIRPK
jgi:hypothetical protein